LVWHFNNLEGLTPEEMERTMQRMDLYDSLPAEVRALVREYGLAVTVNALRQFNGHVNTVREYLLFVRQGRSKTHVP
jgi:predicted xylose isomerase-like sugar epimerase